MLRLAVCKLLCDDESVRDHIDILIILISLQWPVVRRIFNATAKLQALYIAIVNLLILAAIKNVQ